MKHWAHAQIKLQLKWYRRFFVFLVNRDATNLQSKPSANDIYISDLKEEKAIANKVIWNKLF